LRGFPISRRRRDFRDGGDGEPDRPAGTAACAGFPAQWPTAALGRHAWVLAGVRAVPAGFVARTPRVRGGNDDHGLEGAIELSWAILKKNTRDLLGDLLGAKNEGVTVPVYELEPLHGSEARLVGKGEPPLLR
jgi:hypothetical protein